MNTHQHVRRTRRNAQFHVECLDDRVVPSAVHPGAGVAHVAHHHAMHRAVHHAARHAVHHAPAMAAAAVPVFTVSQGDPPAGSIAQTGRGPSGTAKASLVRPHLPTAPVLIVPANPAPSIPTQPASPSPTTPTQPANPTPTNPNSPGPLPSNVTTPLQSLYEQYQNFVNSGGTGTFSPTGLNPYMVINGTSVGVSIHDNNVGDFASLVSQLQSDGLQITISDPTSQTVEGMLPIANLPTIAQLPQAPSVLPMFKPILQ
jgi:hypothetical protein